MNMNDKGSAKYDAFLAHSSKDAAIVEKVLEELENRGIQCCYSKRDCIPGHPVLTFMQNSISESWLTIAFISKDFLESPFCEAERDLALQKALETRRQVLLPVLLDVDIPDLPLAIRGLTCLFFESEDYLKNLLHAMGGTISLLLLFVQYT